MRLFYECISCYYQVLNFVSGFVVFSGLQKYLNQKGFHIAGYGCTTCIRNSGELNESGASAISANGKIIVYASVFLL